MGNKVMEGMEATLILNTKLHHLRSQAARCEEVTVLAKEMLGHLHWYWTHGYHGIVMDEFLARATKILSPEAVDITYPERCVKHDVHGVDCVECYPELYEHAPI